MHRIASRAAGAFAALALGLAAALPAQALQTENYRVAHTRQKDVNMVFVVTGSRFFDLDGNAKARAYTAMQSCVRSVKLAGEVVLVANVNGRFMFYGPKAWNGFLKTLDMNWVRARLNKELTCHF